MRTSSIVVSLAVAASAATAFARPVIFGRDTSIDDLEALLAKRGVALADLGKELGKGLLTGGAFAGLTAAADKLLDPSTPAAKREWAEIEARAVALGDLAKELGKGLLTGGAFAGLTAGAESLLDPSSSSTSKRDISDDELLEFAKRGGLGSVIGKLVGATEDDLPSVIKNAIAGGVATGAGISAGDAALGNNKRELALEIDIQARTLASSLAKLLGDGAGDAIKKGLVGGIGSAIGGTAIGDLLGAGNSTKRAEIEDRTLASSIASLLGDGTGDAIKKGLVGGVGSAIGGTAIGALLDPSSSTSSKRMVYARAPKPLGAVGKGLIGTGVGLAASTLAQDGVDEVEKLFRRIDGLTADEQQQYDQVLAAHLNSRSPLGAVGKGLVGTGIGLAASTLAQDGIDEVEKLFRRVDGLTADEQEQYDQILAAHLSSREFDASSLALRALEDSRVARSLNELD